MPTQTAYAVPIGRPRMAYARPPMLAARPTANTPVGVRRVNPSERPRAVAQTASRTPEMMRTIQCTGISWNAVLSLSGYGVLVRGPVSGLTPRSHVRHLAAGDSGHPPRRRRSGPGVVVPGRHGRLGGFRRVGDRQASCTGLEEMSVNKSELVARLTDRLGGDRALATAAVNGVLEEIQG